MGRIVRITGKGGVQWPTLTVSNGMLPPGAQPVVVVYALPDGRVQVSARGDLLEVLTTAEAESLSTSLREFLVGNVRLKG